MSTREVGRKQKRRDRLKLRILEATYLQLSDGMSPVPAATLEAFVKKRVGPQFRVFMDEKYGSLHRFCAAYGCLFRVDVFTPHVIGLRPDADMVWYAMARGKCYRRNTRVDRATRADVDRILECLPLVGATVDEVSSGSGVTDELTQSMSDAEAYWATSNVGSDPQRSDSSDCLPRGAGRYAQAAHDDRSGGEDNREEPCWDLFPRDPVLQPARAAAINRRRLDMEAEEEDGDLVAVPSASREGSRRKNARAEAGPAETESNPAAASTSTKKKKKKNWNEQRGTSADVGTDIYADLGIIPRHSLFDIDQAAAAADAPTFVVQATKEQSTSTSSGVHAQASAPSSARKRAHQKEAEARGSAGTAVHAGTPSRRETPGSETHIGRDAGAQQLEKEAAQNTGERRDGADTVVPMISPRSAIAEGSRRSGRPAKRDTSAQPLAPTWAARVEQGNIKRRGVDATGSSGEPLRPVTAMGSANSPGIDSNAAREDRQVESRRLPKQQEPPSLEHRVHEFVAGVDAVDSKHVPEVTAALLALGDTEVEALLATSGALRKKVKKLATMASKGGSLVTAASDAAARDEQSEPSPAAASEAVASEPAPMMHAHGPGMVGRLNATFGQPAMYGMPMVQAGRQPNAVPPARGMPPGIRWAGAPPGYPQTPPSLWPDALTQQQLAERQRMQAAAAARDLEDAKRALGDQLYPRVAALQPVLAGKITGMLLELDSDELTQLISTPAALHEKVAEAVWMLTAQQQQRARDATRGAPTGAGAAATAAHNLERAKRALGDQLYPRVAALEPVRAGKITGMLLELDSDELTQLISTPAALHEKVKEAVEVLEKAYQ